MKRLLRLMTVTCGMLVFGAPPFAGARQPASPRAEGFGRNAKDGSLPVSAINNIEAGLPAVNANDGTTVSAPLNNGRIPDVRIYSRALTSGGDITSSIVSHLTFDNTFSQTPAPPSSGFRFSAPPAPSAPAAPQGAQTILQAGIVPQVDHEHITQAFSPAFGQTPAFLAAIQTFNESDTADIRITAVNALNASLKIQEGNSWDDEPLHGYESAGYLAAVPGILYNQDGSPIGETGLLQADQVTSSDWKTFVFQNIYTNPVVILQINSLNDPDPAHVRLRNVTPFSAEYRIEEWDYLDGSHAEETISYLVVEQGIHTLTDSRTLEAWVISAGLAWTARSFLGTFSSTPVVISQCQTFMDGGAVVTRQSSVTSQGFDIRLQEEKSSIGSHFFEDAGYIAVGPP